MKKYKLIEFLKPFDDEVEIRKPAINRYGEHSDYQSEPITKAEYRKYEGEEPAYIVLM